jgi:hypothetical protein
MNLVGRSFGKCLRNRLLLSGCSIRFTIFLIPFYLQDVQIHSANGVKLLEAWRGMLSNTPPYK